MAADNSGDGRRFRSRDWFDDPERRDQTALYLERFMNYGITPGRVAFRKAHYRHCPDRERPLALQPHPRRACDVVCGTVYGMLAVYR